MSIVDRGSWILMDKHAQQLAKVILTHLDGKTQKWLAKESGVSQSVISLVLSGGRLPNLEHLSKIAKALALTPNDLLTPVFDFDAEATEEIYNPIQNQIQVLSRQLMELEATYVDRRIELHDVAGPVEVDRDTPAEELTAIVGHLASKIQLVRSEIERLRQSYVFVRPGEATNFQPRSPSALSPSAIPGPLSASDCAVILARLSEVGPERRAAALAILFDDSSLAPESLAVLAPLLSTIG